MMVTSFFSLTNVFVQKLSSFKVLLKKRAFQINAVHFNLLAKLLFEIENFL